MSEPEVTPPVIAASTKPATKRKKPKSKFRTLRKGRAVGPTPSIWEELRTQYEGGEYSQRELSNYAKAKGFTVSQSRIAMMAIENSWVKGAIRENIRETVLEELKEKMVVEIRSMLERHSVAASVSQAEALAHFRHAAEMRKVDPTFKIPPSQLSTLTQTLRDAQFMEARAKGWNYKEGKPFEVDSELGKQELPSMTIKVMTVEEEEILRSGGDLDPGADKEAA